MSKPVMAQGLRTAAKIHTVSWHEVHRDATDLAKQLQRHEPWGGLVAVSRGGLVPAAIVSRVLGIRRIETICITSYDGMVKGPVEVIKEASPAIGTGAGWLMIDDLVDLGETAERARQLIPAAHYAALYAKPVGRPFVDTFLREIAQDVWIDFPWDRDPALPPV
jgi:xanthine phosphoribosyltransferase